MAPSASSTSSVAALRAVSYRIGSVSTSQLPHIACSVSQSLQSCRDILSQPHTARQSDGEAGVVVHRLNTQIATLLQGRSPEERFAATVLIKAMVEAGGWEVLSKSKHWVTGLINNMKKHDPASTRALILITVTRIFMLTWDYPTLIREITTPSLSGYISTCIGLLQSRQTTLNERQTVLESLASLVPRHPTVFRSHISEINRLVEQDTTSRVYPTALKESAARLASLLHQCEPKQGSSASWERSLEALLKHTHGFVDRVLLGVEEDWQPTGQNVSDKQSLRRQYDRTDASNRVVALYDDSITLTSYIERLRVMVSTSTGAAVNLPVTPIADLTIRLFATTVSLNSFRSSVRYSADVSKEERDALASVLPSVHARAMLLLLALLDRSEDCLASLAQLLLDQLTWLYQCEHGDVDIRTTCYIVLARLLRIVGPSLSKDSIEHLSNVIRGCCNDVLPTGAKSGQNGVSESSGGSTAQSQNNADAFLRQPGQAVKVDSPFKGLQSAAGALLHVLLEKLPASHVPEARRSQMDRTAVLTRQKTALVASVLNPPVKQKAGRSTASLLPFLSRFYAHEAEVESLLRPRMPIVRSKQSARIDVEDGEDDQMALDEDEEEEAESEEERGDLPHDATHAKQEVIDPAPSLKTNHQNDARIGNGFETPTSGTKRLHEEIEPTETDAKRQRASPVARALLAFDQEAVPGMTTTTIADMPRTVVVHKQPEKRGNAGQSVVATLPAGAIRQPVTTAGQPDAGVSDDDDDDFVVPTLDLHDSGDEEGDEDE